jgi:large subunit ribosomal protein L4
VEKLTFSQPKTKEAVKMLAGFGAQDAKALLITDGFDINVVKSARNIPGVKILANNFLNVYDLLNAQKVLLAKEAVAKIEEVLS